MDRAADVVTVVILLIVALVTSKLAAGIRKQAQIADAHAARNATIGGFAGKLLSQNREQDIAVAASIAIRPMFDCNALLVSGVAAPRICAAGSAGKRLA